MIKIIQFIVLITLIVRTKTQDINYCFGVSGGGIRSFSGGVTYFNNFKKFGFDVNKQCGRLYGISGGSWSINAVAQNVRPLRGELGDVGWRWIKGTKFTQWASKNNDYLEPWYQYIKKVMKQSRVKLQSDVLRNHIVFLANKLKFRRATPNCIKRTFDGVKYKMAGNHCVYEYSSGIFECLDGFKGKMNLDLALIISSSAATTDGVPVWRANKIVYCYPWKDAKKKSHLINMGNIVRRDPKPGEYCYQLLDIGNCENTPIYDMLRGGCKRGLIIDDTKEDSTMNSMYWINKLGYKIVRKCVHGVYRQVGYIYQFTKNKENFHFAVIRPYSAYNNNERINWNSFFVGRTSREVRDRVSNLSGNELEVKQFIQAFNKYDNLDDIMQHGSHPGKDKYKKCKEFQV